MVRTGEKPHKAADSRGREAAHQSVADALPRANRPDAVSRDKWPADRRDVLPRTRRGLSTGQTFLGIEVWKNSSTISSATRGVLRLKVVAPLGAHRIGAPVHLLLLFVQQRDVLGAVDIGFFDGDQHP